MSEPEPPAGEARRGSLDPGMAASGGSMATSRAAAPAPMPRTPRPSGGADLSELVHRAVQGRATVLVLFAAEASDATETVHALVRPALQAAGLGDLQINEVPGLAWERDRPGALLERIGLDAEDLTTGLRQWCSLGPQAILITEAADADALSLQRLSSAVQRNPELPLLVVMAAAEPAHEEDPLAELARAHRQTTTRLDRLDGQGVRALAAGIGISLEETAARRLARHADGSTEQVLELLNEHDPADWKSPDAPIPPTRAAVRRIRGLLADDDQVRQLVEACAVIGRWTSMQEVEQLCELDEPLTVLDRAVALGILRVRRASMRLLVGFSSRMVRAAAYESMGVARQRSLHTRAAEVLADQGSRLRQRALAVGGPDAAVADALDEWAKDCAQHGSWEEAGETWLAASRMTLDETLAGRRLVSCLDALTSAGNLFEAEELIPELESTTVSPMRDAVLGYHQLLRGHRDEAEVLLQQAWRAADDSDRATRSAIAHRLALHALVDWDSAALVHWAEQAIDLADKAVPSAPSGLEAHTMLGLGLGGEGRAEEALSTYAQLTSTVRSGAQGQRAMMGQGWLHRALDRVPLAAHELELAAPLSAWRGSTRISLWANGWLAHSRLALGDLNAAQVAIDRGVPLLEQTGQNAILPLMHWAGAQLAALRGDAERAEHHAAVAASVRTEYQGMLVASIMARAWVGMLGGDHAGVVRAFEPLLLIDRHPGIDEPGFWPWQDVYAIALVALGEVQRADEFLRPHEELAEARQHRSSIARLGAVRGRMLIASGELGAGREAFERSLAVISDLPLTLLRTRIHFAYGQSLRRAGKRRDAEAELHRARRGYAAMGASGYVQRCDRELKAGGRTRDAESLTELTPQEQAVVDLVVQGMTNREVAANLFISVKTVQYHLTRVYARLGVRSRAELVALRHGGG